MPSLFDNLKNRLDTIRTKEADRKVYLRIDDAHVDGEEASHDVVSADSVYFRVTLNEMFIRYERDLWKTFLPFVLMVCKCEYDSKDREIPVFAGNELLKSVEKYIEGEAVEYRNTTMIGPTPYAGGNLGLFVGLFRTKKDDLANKLVDLVSEIGAVFPVAELKRYLDILGPLGHGISSIVGIKDVEMRIGVRDEFSEDGPNKLRAGYFVYINCSETTMVSSQLWVKEGGLWTGIDRPERRFREDDYCLVQLDFVKERAFSTLPFASKWKEVKNTVWSNQEAKAQALFLELCRELAVSPDITTMHRFNLVRVLKADLEHEIEVANAAKTPRTDSSSTRGIAVGSGGQAAIQKTLSALNDSHEYRGERESLRAVSAIWKELTKDAPRGADVTLTDETVTRQLSEVLTKDPAQGDPKKLVDALTYATFRR